MDPPSQDFALKEEVADDTVLAYEMGCYYQWDVRNENKWFKNSKKSRYLMLFMALIGSSIVISAGVLVPVLSVFSASIGLAQSLSGTIFKTSGDRENFNTRFATIIGMIVTTCFMSLTISLHWNNRFAAISFIAFFGIIEATYFVACSLNFIHGSWLLVILAVLTLAIMMSWHYGTVKMHYADAENMVLMEHITNLSHAFGIHRVPGIGFVFADIIRGIPPFFSHFTINFPAIHQMLIFVSFKSVPVAHLPPSMQCLVGRLGPKQWRMYRCILRHGYADNILDINELENQIIHGICELISKVNDENSKIIIASDLIFSGESEENGENGRNPARKVRFVLPPDSPVMCSSAREELQDLIDAQEHGATYICCHPYLSSSKGSHFLKNLLNEIYIFLQKNCRKKFRLVNIPNAAYVEVGMCYSI